MIFKTIRFKIITQNMELLTIMVSHHPTSALEIQTHIGMGNKLKHRDISIPIQFRNHIYKALVRPDKKICIHL